MEKIPTWIASIPYGTTEFQFKLLLLLLRIASI